MGKSAERNTVRRLSLSRFVFLSGTHAGLHFHGERVRGLDVSRFVCTLHSNGVAFAYYFALVKFYNMTVKQ
jgi:hypothetical protein